MSWKTFLITWSIFFGIKEMAVLEILKRNFSGFFENFFLGQDDFLRFLEILHNGSKKKSFLIYNGKWGLGTIGTLNFAMQNDIFL